jgi:hypothetical protein
MQEVQCQSQNRQHKPPQLVEAKIRAVIIEGTLKSGGSCFRLILPKHDKDSDGNDMMCALSVREEVIMCFLNTECMFLLSVKKKKREQKQEL